MGGPLIKSRTQQCFWEILNDAWFISFGPPECSLLDKDGGINSEFFSEKCSDTGVAVRLVSADAHFCRPVRLRVSALR